MIKNIALIISILYLSGCVSGGAIPADYKLGKPGTSIFVIGVKTDYEYTFLKNGVNDEVFSTAGFAGGWRGKAENGYLIGEIKSNESYGLGEISGYNPNLFLHSFCGGGETITFSLPENRIIYLGHISEFEFSRTKDSQLDATIDLLKVENKFESALKHVNENYPHLAEKLEQGNYKLIPTSDCVVNTPVYIY